VARSAATARRRSTDNVRAAGQTVKCSILSGVSNESPQQGQVRRSPGSMSVLSDAKSVRNGTTLPQRMAASSLRRSRRRRSSPSAMASETTSHTGGASSGSSGVPRATSERNNGGAMNVVTITINATEL
jgi:hypothetical protein